MLITLAAGLFYLIGAAMPTGLLFSQDFTRIVLSDDSDWSEGGNWIDYDGDDDLDLFIPNNRRVRVCVTTIIEFEFFSQQLVCFRNL